MMKLSIQHQARELLHGIELLTRCLLIPNCSARMRAGWNRDMVTARADLEGLYTAGLDRNHLLLSNVTRLPTLDVQPVGPRTGMRRRH